MLTKEQKQSYEEQGYLIIKKCYHSGEINDLDTHSNVRERCWKNDAKEVLKQTTFFKEETRFIQVGDSLMEIYNNSAKELLLERLNWIGNLDPFFLQISLDYRILSIVSVLLSTLKVYHLVNQLNYKRPGSAFSIAWHQDAQFRHKECSDFPESTNNQGHSITVITAIDLCTPNNGTLYVLPGSHKLGFLNLTHNLKPKDIQQQFMDTYQINVEASQVPIFLEPGDLLLMHENLFHYASRNHSMQSRRILLNVFSSFKINNKPEVFLALSRLRGMLAPWWHPRNIAPSERVVKQCKEPELLMDDEDDDLDMPPSDLMTKFNQYYGLNTNDQFFKNNNNQNIVAAIVPNQLNETVFKK